MSKFIENNKGKIFLVLGMLCLLSTPIARSIVDFHAVPDDVYICLVSSYAQSIRVFCGIGTALGLFYRK